MTQNQLQALVELKNLKEAQIINDTEFVSLKVKILADKEPTPTTSPKLNDVIPTKVNNIEDHWISVMVAVIAMTFIVSLIFHKYDVIVCAIIIFFIIFISKKVSNSNSQKHLNEEKSEAIPTDTNTTNDEYIS